MKDNLSKSHSDEDGTWFSENKSSDAPPLWKQTMLLIVALFPALMVESDYILPLMHQLNYVVAKFISVAMTVSLTSFLLMPLTVYLLRWWLECTSKKKEYLGISIVMVLYLIELLVFMLLR